jgi:hypothetical protein
MSWISIQNPDSITSRRKLIKKEDVLFLKLEPVPFLAEKYKTAWKMLFGTLIVGKMTAVEVLARGGGFDKASYIKC